LNHRPSDARKVTMAVASAAIRDTPSGLTKQTIAPRKGRKVRMVSREST
jgi:hypothetical protein